MLAQSESISGPPLKRVLSESAFQWSRISSGGINESLSDATRTSESTTTSHRKQGRRRCRNAVTIGVGQASLWSTGFIFYGRIQLQVFSLETLQGQAASAIGTTTDWRASKALGPSCSWLGVCESRLKPSRHGRISSEFGWRRRSRILLETLGLSDFVTWCLNM